ncbi:MAG: ATPase domain-containing protein [Promethearchaeota archaeon]
MKASATAQNDEMPFFIYDGVVTLNMPYSPGDYVRTIRVVKMRGAKHVMKPMMFKIGSDGIVAFPDARLPE